VPNRPARCNWHERRPAVAVLIYYANSDHPMRAPMCQQCYERAESNPLLRGRGHALERPDQTRVAL
jgi:hypothetical protein